MTRIRDLILRNCELCGNELKSKEASNYFNYDQRTTIEIATTNGIVQLYSSGHFCQKCLDRFYNSETGRLNRLYHFRGLIEDIIGKEEQSSG